VKSEERLNRLVDDILRHNFTDELGHKLELCEPFQTLVSWSKFLYEAYDHPTLDDKNKTKVNVSITNTDVFKEVLNLLVYAFSRLPEAEQDELNKRLEYVLKQISD
jgi:hypothetical protein